MYDLEEQEQIDAIKAWWKAHGNLILTALIIGLLVFTAITGWRYYQRTHAHNAAERYAVLQSAIQQKDVKKAQQVVSNITDKYASTAYAGMAVLAGAKLNFESGDLKAAKAQLQWAVQHAKQQEMQDVARLRLAAILLEEKNYAEALKLLSVKHNEAFDALYLDLKGDVLAAQGKAHDARTAYKASLEKLSPKNGYRNLVQMKLDALGDPS